MLCHFRSNAIKQIILVLLFGLAVASYANNRQIVAEYTGGSVSVDEFLNDYRNYLKMTGLNDNMVSRKLILDNVINEKIAIAEFTKARLDQDPEFTEKQNSIRDQLLLNSLFEKKVMQIVHFNDNQLANYYSVENTLFHVKQLFTENYDSAKVYCELLKAGLSIESLIKKLNITDVKYDMGFIKINDVHPQFRKVIQNLPVGGVSQPLKGMYGYTVLVLEDKREKPLLTEYEFAKQKKYLMKKMAIEYQDSLRSDYIKKMVKQLKVEWNDAKLPGLLDVLININGKDNLPVHNDIKGISSDPICIIDGTGYNYNALMPLILKSRDQHIKSIRNLENLKEFIAGIIVREHLISEAKELKLDQDKVFQEQFQQKITKLKIDTWIENLSAVQFSDDDYQLYYKNNQSEFVIPVRREVYEIRLPNKDLVVKCLQRIQSGEKFQSINNEFSGYKRNSTINGYLGLLTSSEVGKFGNAIFSAPVDSVVGPFEYQDAYYLFISANEQPPHYLSLQEARPIIEKKYHQELSQAKMQHYFSQKTDEYHVKKNFKVLKSIDYQDYSGKRGIIANE